MNNDSPDKDHEATLSLSHPIFVFLNLAYLLVFSNVSLFYLYPLKLDAMGTHTSHIGWVMGVFSLAAVTSRPLMGSLAVRRGEFPLMVSGISVMIAGTACYPFLKEVGLSMFLVRIAHGLGFSAFVTGSFSSVAVLFSVNRRAQAYAIVGASLMAAAALAPLAGEALIHRYGFNGLYIAAFSLLVFAWILLAATAPRVPGSREDRAGQRARYAPLIKNRKFLVFLAATLIFAHCQSTVFNFIALAAEEKGASPGLFFFIAFSLSIGILLTMGRVIDRLGKVLFINLFFPIFCLSFALIPPLFGKMGGWVPPLLFGTGMGFLFPAFNALAADSGEDDQKPAVMSVFTGVYDSGFITGAVFSGWLAQWSGLDALFYITGGIAAIGFLVSLATPRKTH